MRVLLWLVVIGAIAGSIARVIMPGPNTPKGFFVNTIIGTSGAVLSSIGGEYLGIYHRHLHVGAGLIGATVGAVIILVIWNRLVAWGVISDHGL